MEEQANRIFEGRVESGVSCVCLLIILENID